MYFSFPAAITRPDRLVSGLKTGLNRTPAGYYRFNASCLTQISLDM